MSYDYGYGYAGPGRQQGTPTAPAGPTGGTTAIRAPSGGGGGGGTRITPSGGAPAVSRPQKTEVLNHAEQSRIGGPGAPSPPPAPVAPPHPGMPSGGLPPTVHPSIGEHAGEREGQFRPPSQRDERAHPDQFRDWDRRFDQDRDRLRNNYWRTGFTDYDRDRFIHLFRDDRLLYHIFGVTYYPEYITYAVPYYPVDCGTWVIGADGRWYRVSASQLSIISRIESLRGIGLYRPVVIPCGWGWI